jgi:hypothetical protein
VNLAPSVTNPPSTATSHVNPSPSAADPPATATSEARATMDAPTVPETDREAAKDRQLNQKRYIENLKKDAPEWAVEREFIHGWHTCDRCLCRPIVGKRFHATNLPDYDLCEKCKDGYKGTEIQFEAAELGTFVETLLRFVLTIARRILTISFYCCCFNRSRPSVPGALAPYSCQVCCCWTLWRPHGSWSLWPHQPRTLGLPQGSHA